MSRIAIQFVRAVDRLTEAVGRAVAWLAAAMVAVVAINVAMRYVLGHSSMALQELSWHMFGVLFLGAAGWTLRHGRHVRVDLWYASASPRARHAVDLLGHVLFTVPLCAVAIWVSLPFVADAWAIGERSADAGGLSARWAIKAAIPAGLALLLLQGLAEAARAGLALAGHGDAVAVTGPDAPTPGSHHEGV